MIEPIIIKPLTNFWMVGIALSIIISYLIISIGIKLPPNQRRIMMISFGVLILLMEAIQQIYYFKKGIWNLETSVPLHLCGVSILLSGLVIIKPYQSIFEFLALIGSPGAFHALLTPQLNHGFAPFLAFKYYFGHTAIILIPLFLAIVQGYRVRTSSWYRVFLMVQLLIIIIMIINQLFGSNYMYLYEKPLVSSPMILGDWPWYILGFEFFGFIHIIIFYFAYRLFKPLPY